MWLLKIICRLYCRLCHRKCHVTFMSIFSNWIVTPVRYDVKTCMKCGESWRAQT